MAAAAPSAVAAPAHADDSAWKTGGTPWQVLPKELLECILDELLYMNMADEYAKPLSKLYCTDRATRSVMLQWQRRKAGAAHRARIGATEIELQWDDEDGLDGLEQLTNRTPGLATLRRLHLLGETVPESCLVGFLLQPGAKKKLATVLELTVGEEEEAQEEEEEEEGREDQAVHRLSNEAFTAISSACPSLVALTLHSPIQGLGSLGPLHQLSSLNELVVKANVLPDDDGISHADLAALGSLTSLNKLSICTDELATVLAGLSSLTLLADVSLEGELIPPDIPKFSALSSLQHLTHLRWAHPGGPVSTDTFILAIRSCTQLVSLALPGHDEVRPQQLLLMPRLKILEVGGLDLSEPLPLDQGCGLESLRLVDAPFTGFLAELLPLCRAVKHLDLPWLSTGMYHLSVGPASTPQLASAEVHRVGVVAQALAELAALSGRAVEAGLEVNWIERVHIRFRTDIIAALSPLRQCLRKVCLLACNPSMWALQTDRALVDQLAEAIPGLEVLSLDGCAVHLDAWQGLLRLTRLSRLELHRTQSAPRDRCDENAVQKGWEALVAYAAEVQRDLTVFISISSRGDAFSPMSLHRGSPGSDRPVSRREVAAQAGRPDVSMLGPRYQQLVEERRRAACASGCVRIVVEFMRYDS